MKHRLLLPAWLFLAGIIAVLLSQLHSTAVQAAPFLSPTPASSLLNQPYVAFQQERAWQQMFRFDDGVPVLLVILTLISLFILAIFSFTSFRPRH